MNNNIKSKEVKYITKLQTPLKKENIRGYNELKFDNEYFESSMKLKHKHRIMNRE